MKNNLSVGIAGLNNESAIALNYVSIIDYGQRTIDWSASIADSAYAGTMGRVAFGISW